FSRKFRGTSREQSFKIQRTELILKAYSNLDFDDFSTLMLVEESNSKTLKPAIFESLTTL
ncbi:hypothetical protein, partial [Vibrio penaeicida]|uniref:hypothetical protein n=1 Tax=Vibrio penaeicida TaxID=104609 RepID=UPI001C8CAF3D